MGLTVLARYLGLSTQSNASAASHEVSRLECMYTEGRDSVIPGKQQAGRLPLRILWNRFAVCGEVRAHSAGRPQQIPLNCNKLASETFGAPIAPCKRIGVSSNRLSTIRLLAR
jgi:hypothetical protein